MEKGIKGVGTKICRHDSLAWYNLGQGISTKDDLIVRNV
jgi:hypothetical protein